MKGILAILGKPKKGGDMVPSASEGEEEERDESADHSADEDEVTAAREVRNAKTDQEYADALKGFIKICTGDY